MNVLGETVRYLRLQRDMSQDELAELIGYTNGRAMISRIEAGKADPPLSRIIKLAEALHVKPSVFLDGLSSDEDLTATLTDAERSNLTKYRSVNQAGREHIDEYISLISERPEYQKKSV